ncbi:MAG TPA: hypothetical protein VIO60_11080 [Rectinemataceae bacterium]
MKRKKARAPIRLGKLGKGGSFKRKVSNLPFSGVSEETAGLPPGSATYIGDTEPTQATYSIYSCKMDSAVMRVPQDVNELAALIDPDVNNWININGLSGGAVEKYNEPIRLDRMVARIEWTLAPLMLRSRVPDLETDRPDWSALRKSLSFPALLNDDQLLALIRSVYGA